MENPIDLTQLTPGDIATVVGYRCGDNSYRRKLLAMGLTTGTTFTLERIAPFGDPIQIRLRGSTLCLRRGEANCLALERVRHD